MRMKLEEWRPRASASLLHRLRSREAHPQRIHGPHRWGEHTDNAGPMPVPVGPRPLPPVVLSRDLGGNAVREARAAGLVRVSHGAFVEPLAEPQTTWEEREHVARARVAAVAHRLTAETVFSHESAALLHGLWLYQSPATVHVVQHRRPRRQTPGLHRHTGELPAEDVTAVHGLRVTSIERTIVDCAKSLHPRDALAVADSGMRLIVQPQRHEERRSVTARTEALRTRLLTAVERGARRGRRQARMVIAYADPYSESPYETVIRWIAVSRGLPRPLLQFRFDIRGSTYYSDMCWFFELTIDGTTFRLCLIAEYDGEGKYLAEAAEFEAGRAQSAADAVIAEKNRENDLRSRPNTLVVRFERRDARQIAATFHRLCESLPSSYVATLRLVPELIGLAAPRRGAI